MINKKFKSALRLLVGGTALVALCAPAHARDGVKTGGDGLTLTAADGAFELTLGGRLHLDALAYDGDASDFQDADVRRARIELSGKIADIIRFRIDREFAGNDGWRNVWASVRPIDELEITAGNFTVPFAMEDMQSSNRIPLMERSLTNALAPGFSLGAGFEYSRRHWTLAAGYFSDPLDNEDDQSDERGQGFAGRATLAPINRSGKLVHIGAAIERRSFGDGDIARFQTNPGSALAPTLLGTGGIADPEDLTNLGGEVALSRGPVLLQGQYIATELTRTANPTLNFDGWHVQAAWLVTGGRYGYSRRSGVVTGADLRRGKGAFELAARYSTLDLDDDGFARGHGRSITLGANWYVNENVRLMANYVRSEAQDVGGQPDREGNLVAGRFQVSF